MFDFLCFSVGYDLDVEGCVCFVSMDWRTFKMLPNCHISRCLLCKTEK